MAQKQNAAPKPTSKESNTPDNHAHDRLVFLVTSFIVSLSTLDPTRDGTLILLRAWPLPLPRRTVRSTLEYSLRPPLNLANHPLS